MTGKNRRHCEERSDEAQKREARWTAAGRPAGRAQRV